MQLKTKKAIAREGLIFIGIMALVAVADFTDNDDTAISLLFYGYPSYWLIRFMFWAVGTLKQKETQNND